MKLCVNCKFCVQKNISYNCTHELSKSVDIVNGNIYYNSCGLMRSIYFECDKEGKLWEQKEIVEVPKKRSWLNFLKF